MRALVFGSLRGYRRTWLTGDVVAGLTVWAVDVRAIVIDAETVPSIDVTAARMLLALRADLERDGVELVLARDVGQVRDVLEAADEGRPSIPTYRTVREAVEAVGHPSGVMRHHPAST